MLVNSNKLELKLQEPRSSGIIVTVSHDML